MCPLSAPGSLKEGKLNMPLRKTRGSECVTEEGKNFLSDLFNCMLPHIMSCISKALLQMGDFLGFLDDILLIAQESLTSVDILKLARLVRVARCRIPNLDSNIDVIVQVLAEDGSVLSVLCSHTLPSHGLLLSPRPLACLSLVS